MVIPGDSNQKCCMLIGIYIVGASSNMSNMSAPELCDLESNGIHKDWWNPGLIARLGTDK